MQNDGVREVNQLLLPMDHVDLLICDEGEFIYQAADNLQSISGCHFHGLRDNPIKLVEIPLGLVIGVSFVPWGYQPFVATSMQQFRNKIVPISEIDHRWANEIEAVIRQKTALDIVLNQIFSALEGAATLKNNAEKAFEQIISFLQSDTSSVAAFATESGIDQKHLQRLFSTYVGIPPKEFLKLYRFEKASRSVMFEEKPYLDIAFENAYYDQPHMVREFKRYTGVSPRHFKKAEPALKSHLKFK